MPQADCTKPGEEDQLGLLILPAHSAERSHPRRVRSSPGRGPRSLARHRPSRRVCCCPPDWLSWPVCPGIWPLLLAPVLPGLHATATAAQNIEQIDAEDGFGDRNRSTTRKMIVERLMPPRPRPIRNPHAAAARKAKAAALTRADPRYCRWDVRCRVACPLISRRNGAWIRQSRRA